MNIFPIRFSVQPGFSLKQASLADSSESSPTTFSTATPRSSALLLSSAPIRPDPAATSSKRTGFLSPSNSSLFSKRNSGATKWEAFSRRSTYRAWYRPKFKKSFLPLVF